MSTPPWPLYVCHGFSLLMALPSVALYVLECAIVVADWRAHFNTTFYRFFLASALNVLLTVHGLLYSIIYPSSESALLLCWLLLLQSARLQLAALFLLYFCRLPQLACGNILWHGPLLPTCREFSHFLHAASTPHGHFMAT